MSTHPLEFPPRNGVRFIKNVMVPMADGVRLAMDLHVPDSAAWASTPRPVILEYIPYRKDDAAPYTGDHFVLAQHGFIAARLDCRGTGSSEGINTDEYTPQEQQDGVEAIEWIASQPWCNGKVGMYGSSYGGFTAIQIAARQPPHLTTIIPMYFTDDRYTDDCHYRGGAWRCYYDIGAYGASMIGMNAMPPYPEYSGEDWARIWEEHLEHNTPYLLEWLAHPTDGAYWQTGSVRGRYNDIQCSVFMIGGWRDGYPNPPLRTFAQLKTPKKVLIGPWNHARPATAIPGPRINYLREVIRWCDYWLKGEANGVMDDPPICVYMQSYDEPHADRLETTGYWRTELDWPAPGGQTLTLYPSDDGGLHETPPAQPSSHGYDYRSMVGICGGLWSGGVPYGLPTDQRPDEVYSLNYTSMPLDGPLEIMGMPTVRLYAETTAPVMVFVARLCDVAPDGTSALVCNGVLNATRHDSLTHPTPLVPGQVYPLTIDLDCTAWRFEPGHRIRLSICSADFPNLWPTPYPGHNRVHLGPDLTRLDLPTVPTKAIRHEAVFTLSPVATVDIYRHTPTVPAWELVHDMLGGRVGLRQRRRGVTVAGPDIEITSDADLEVWASQRDPAHVSAVGKHFRHIKRSDGEMTVDTVAALRSTETAFHLTIDLSITVNGFPHHTRRWVRSFPRLLM